MAIHVRSHTRGGKTVKAYSRGGVAKKMDRMTKSIVRARADSQNNPLMGGFLHPITGNVRGLIKKFREDKYGESHDRYGASRGRKELHDVDFRKLKSSYKFKKYNKKS